MITVGMATPVGASRERVWRALSEPAEVLCWRPGVVDSLDPQAPYPEPARRVRWRCRVHGLPVVLHETPLEVRRGERIHSRIALGPFRFEEIFTLSGEGHGRGTEAEPEARPPDEAAPPETTSLETTPLQTIPVQTIPVQTIRLGVRIVARNQMPLPGGDLDRFAVRRFATELCASYVEAVRAWCEGSPAAPRPVPLPSLPEPVVAQGAALR